MDQADAEQIVIDIYELAYRRKPRVKELAAWSRAMSRGSTSAHDLIRKCLTSVEYATTRGVKTQFPPGHFHSPVVDPQVVGDYYSREMMLEPDNIPGIPLDTQAMRALWLTSLPFIQRTPFEDAPNQRHRYCYTGGPFPCGDAITLRMMMGHYRPRRVIEIGSGYSSACMLDSAEELALDDFHLTCIEPNTERLKSLLRPGDEARLRIVESVVQNVAADIVDSLEANDILFIDSTHVVKTGSDVHYELFHLLPRLKPGVVVHFHDIGYPFEYPHRWVMEENKSWNEAYFLRSFLMWNTRFRITFWNSLFAKTYRREIDREFPTFLQNGGSSIWLERVGAA